MATMTIRLPDEKHHRLRLLAERNGVSLNKLVEEWASMALAQFDAETRFLARAARGSAKRGLALLDKLDQGFAPSAIRRRSAKKRRD
jgi:predicted transcriptional regulator